MSYLLHATRVMLDGGNYISHFFETNPPLILYLYIPSVLVTDLLGANSVLVFRLYIFLLASLSLSICYFYLWRIFTRQDQRLASVMIIALASIFLVLPVYDFGQRENLTIILTLPYLLLITWRLMGGMPGKLQASFIGLLAGFGFCLKPYFLVIPALLELYYLLRQKRLFAWLRPETLMLAFFTLTYAASIYLFYPAYIAEIVPFTLRYYYSGVGTSWRTLLSNELFLFCLLPLLFYGALHRINSYKILSTVFLLALLGYAFSYLLMGTIFYYHFIPAFSMGALLMVYFFSLLAVKLLPQRGVYFSSFFIGLLVFLYLCMEIRVIWAMQIFCPPLFFGFLGVLFLALFYLGRARVHFLKFFLASVLIIAVTYLYYFLAARVTGDAFFNFYSTIFVALVTFALLGAHLDGKLQAKPFLMAILGMTLFSFPTYQIGSLYLKHLSYRNVQSELIDFLHGHAQHQSVCFFSTKAFSYDYPDTELLVAQRYSSLWMVAGMVNKVGLDESKLSPQALADKALVIRLVTESLHLNKPAWILIDVTPSKLYLGTQKFSYLSYFATNQPFQQEWKNYRYFTTVSHEPYYKLQVYRRLERDAL